MGNRKKVQFFYPFGKEDLTTVSRLYFFLYDTLLSSVCFYNAHSVLKNGFFVSTMLTFISPFRLFCLSGLLKL